MSLTRVSECFRLTNVAITLLSCPLLFLQSGSLWQSSISSGSISTPGSLRILITVFKILVRNVVWYAWYLHVVSAAILDPPLPFRVIIFNINYLFLQFMVNIFYNHYITLSFLFSATIWFILSISLSIFSESLCRSASTVPFLLKSRVFRTTSDFFNEFNADLDKFKIFLLLSPILNNLLTCPRREMKILKFNR